MFLGESLNPAIDIGQIEGAFMQGYGLYVLEELVYSPTGETITKGPGTYKIPGFMDIPGEFNVSLLKGVSNPRAVYSSKVSICGSLEFYIEFIYQSSILGGWRTTTVFGMFCFVRNKRCHQSGPRRERRGKIFPLGRSGHSCENQDGLSRRHRL